MVGDRLPLSTRTPGAARPWRARHQGLSPSRCPPATCWPPQNQTPDRVHLDQSLDESLMIDSHCHCLSHFWVAGQYYIVKIEVHGLEGCAGGRSNYHKIVE